MKKTPCLFLLFLGAMLLLSILAVPSISASSPGLLDNCDSLAGGNWTVNFGQNPVLSLNTIDKIEGTASIQYIAGSGSWSGSLWDSGNWDFTNAPILTCYIKVSHLGNGISLDCWAGGSYYKISQLQIAQANTWTYCTADLSAINGLPLNKVDILVFSWTGDIIMAGQTFQIDNVRTASNTSPTTTPTSTPSPQISQTTLDSCDSLPTGKWLANFGQNPVLNLNTLDKVEGTASIQYIAGSAWSGNLWDIGGWDFSNTPTLTCYIKVSHVGNGVSLSCWAGGSYYRVRTLQVNQANTWTYCTADLSSVNGLPLNHVDVLVFSWDGDIDMKGQTFQIDYLRMAGNTSPTPTPTPSNPVTPLQTAFDSCDSFSGGNWAVNFGQNPALTLNTLDKIEGTASIQYTAGGASWSGSLWDSGNWDFTNTPTLACYIKVSRIGNGITLGCWAGGSYYKIKTLEISQANTWTYCTADLSSVTWLPLNHIDILVFEWNGDIMMAGQTFQIDNIKTASYTSPAPTPTPTPTQTPSPPNPTPTSPSAQPNFGIYQDQACTNQVGTSTISWGQLYPGSTKTVAFYIRNNGNSPITLSKTVGNFNPTTVGTYLTLNWDYYNQVLNPGSTLKITLTLNVASNTPTFSNFNFDTAITATG
jgi:hypothetical protein